MPASGAFNDIMRGNSPFLFFLHFDGYVCFDGDPAGIKEITASHDLNPLGRSRSTTVVPTDTTNRTFTTNMGTKNLYGFMLWPP